GEAASTPPPAQAKVTVGQGSVSVASKGQAQDVGNPVATPDKDNQGGDARRARPDGDPSNPRRGSVPPRSSTGSEGEPVAKGKGDLPPPAAKGQKGGVVLPPIRRIPPSGIEGTGLAFNQPGGVVSSPPTYTILSPLFSLSQFLVRFSNEGDEIPS